METIMAKKSGCAVCGESLAGKSMFKHYLGEHPLVAAVTWKCCIPKAVKAIPEIAAQRKAKGWDK